MLWNFTRRLCIWLCEKQTAKTTSAFMFVYHTKHSHPKNLSNMNDVFHQTNVCGWNRSFQDFMPIFTPRRRASCGCLFKYDRRHNIHNYMTELEGCWFRKSRFVGPPLKTSSEVVRKCPHLCPLWYSAHKSICWICKPAWRSSRPCSGGRKKQPLTALVCYSPKSAAR